MEMLALQFFSREQSDQGAPLRKMHIKGNLIKNLIFEGLYKSRLIAGDSIFSIEEKGVFQTWKRPCIHPICRHHRSKNNLTKIDIVQTPIQG